MLTGTPTECEPLPRIRWAQEFEALRDASDGYMAATGARPKVFLVNLGPVAVHTARATFAKNFFEAGGIEAVTSETGSTTGFDDPADAVRDVLAVGAHLVCLCSSDGVYAERAVEFAPCAVRSGALTAVPRRQPGGPSRRGDRGGRHRVHPRGRGRARRAAPGPRGRRHAQRSARPMSTIALAPPIAPTMRRTHR